MGWMKPRQSYEYNYKPMFKLLINTLKIKFLDKLYSEGLNYFHSNLQQAFIIKMCSYKGSFMKRFHVKTEFLVEVEVSNGCSDSLI